jgi:hypothetical protein
MRRLFRHLFTFASAASLVLCVGTGCADKLAARGDFVGRAAPVFVQTMDGEDHTVYVLQIVDGPMFTDPDTTVHASHEVFPSARELAVLHKDRRGNAYNLDPKLVGRTLRVTGVMRIHGQTLIKGRELLGTGDYRSAYATNFGLQVSRVQPVD